jgi:hypothetical protein
MIVRCVRSGGCAQRSIYWLPIAITVARYYNYSGAGVVWEHPDASLDPLIDELLAASSAVVNQIGPPHERPPPPPADQMRIAFLTPSGLHFGQGPTPALSRDPSAGRVVQLATGLMTALIGKSTPNGIRART